MSIPIIDTLKPLGNFPAVSSEDIQCGDMRLDAVLVASSSELAKKVDKTYVDAELAKKANASMVTELAKTVDTKASAANVTALQTRTTALETTVSGKADSTTVSSLSERVTENTTKTVDLQAQIDSLVVEAGGDSNPEVVQARTDASGVTHTALKSRIDTEVTDLKSDLSLLNDNESFKGNLIFKFGKSVDGLDSPWRATTDFITVDSDFEICSDVFQERLSINLELYNSVKESIGTIPTTKTKTSKIYFKRSSYSNVTFVKVWLCGFTSDSKVLDDDDIIASKHIRMTKKFTVKSIKDGIEEKDLLGGFHRTTGAFINDTPNRATTAVYYLNEPDILIMNKDYCLYDCYFKFYDENFNFINDGAWHSKSGEPYTESTAPYFEIVFRNRTNPNATITREDITKICNGYKVGNLYYGYTISSIDGEIHSAGSRACELNRIYVKDAYIKSINPDYCFYVECFDSEKSGNIINEYGWIGEKGRYYYTDSAVRVVDSWIQLVFAKKDLNSNFTSDEFYQLCKEYDSKNIYSITESISPLEIGEIVKNGYPIYYNSEVKTTVDTIGKKTMYNPIKFAMITDLHDNTIEHLSETVESQVNAIKDIHEKIGLDFVICGGDLTDGGFADKSKLLDKFSEHVKMFKQIGVPVLFLRGNHDDNSYAGNTDVSKVISKPEWFSRCVASFNGKKTVNDRIYYYQDFDAIDTRVVCLDFIDYPWLINESGQLVYSASGDNAWRGYSNEQIEWLCGTALNTNKRIIVTGHYSTHPNLMTTWEKSKDVNYTVVNNAMKAYNSRTTLNFNGKTFNFADKTGKVLCQVSGHSHSFGAFIDNGIVWSTTGSPSPEVTKRTYDDTPYETMSTRNYGDITEAHFNVFVCDSNSVNIISFGQMGDLSFEI